MNRYLIPSFALGTFVFGVGQAQAAQVTIDNFNTVDQSVEVLGNPGTMAMNAMTNGDNNIIGGERKIKLTIEENEFNDPDLGAIVSIVDGFATVSNDAGIESTTVFTWDGTDTSPLNADLTGGGMNQFFRLDINSVDLQAKLALDVTDSDGDMASLTKTGLSEGSAIFNFNAFNNFAATDFNSVESVSLTVGGPQEVDFTADSLVATVPEPLTILGSGLALGFGALFKKESSRKRQKAQSKN